uniref:ATPase AAA-type core domain-containing protein n=1 Tax=Dictyoglomus turgidum TaxID=513050 RepID=A0A7C3WNF7_9BACT
MTIDEKVLSLNNKIYRLVGIRDSLKKDLKSVLDDISEKEKDLSILSKVKRLFEVFIKGMEVQSKKYIEPIVTEALHFIFNQNLYFHIVFVNRRNQIEVDFVVLPNLEKETLYQEYLKDFENYKEEIEEMLSNYSDIAFLYGGAVSEVLGLILRFLFAELLKIEGPIILDEPTSSVHEEYANRVGIFIKSLSERFNRQVIFVTHSQALASSANKVYEVIKDNDVSTIKEL